ncbi:MYCBP-associated protein-like isoform X2 [Amphiura filiformis]|uniref:MYCBP-associated protein-like isoform X2 n=1 Tax=Amphiura filiformis TaxID=82378 RepID=UPI003B20B968
MEGNNVQGSVKPENGRRSSVTKVTDKKQDGGKVKNKESSKGKDGQKGKDTDSSKDKSGLKSSSSKRQLSPSRKSPSSSAMSRSSSSASMTRGRATAVHAIGRFMSSYKIKSNKRRDGTPEKPVTPNQSQSQMEEEVVPPSKLKIDGEDVQALAINLEELSKVRAPKPPAGDRRIHSAKKRGVIVRKMKPQSELDKPKMKQILIAQPAPRDATLKQEDYSGCAGPRYDTIGNIVPHSILGSVEDFKLEAVHQGQMEASQLNEIDTRPKTPSIKFEKKTKEVHPKPREANMDEDNALRNWQMKMIERKKQQGYISKLLQKPVEALVMNKSEDYRKTQEDRYLIDRSIPAMDYGKGYRVGSEFWKQQERVGDDLSGVHMTLTQTERGYPPPVEHISHPQSIKKEMGTEWKPPSTPTNYPWHLSQYLKERREELQHVLDDVDPCQPASGELEVIGKSLTNLQEEANQIKEAKQGKMEKKPLSAVEEEKTNVDQDKQVDAPITGPSLQFNDYAASWTGDSHSRKNSIAHGARVTFEAFAGERITSFLQLVNNGTTTIYYDWKKIPKVNPFEGCATPKVQRFYFNTSSGVLLPGESLKFPFVFKSPNAGIFSETWQLDTRPVLCGGAALQVTLRGVALQEDKNKKQRNEIEQELFHKQAEMTIRRIIDDLVDGVKTPERSHSPIDAYITDEEKFERNNPGMHYSSEVVDRLHQLYLEQFPEEEREGMTWDLSVETMKREFLSLDDEELQEDLLARMNASVTSLYFPPFTPIQHEMYKVGYQMMAETVDNIVSQAAVLRDHLGMPEKDVPMPETEAILAANEQLRGGIVVKKRERKKRREHKEEEEEPKGKGKKDKGKDAGKKGGKKEDKEKDRPKSKQGGGKSKSRNASSPTPSTRERRAKTPTGDRKTPTPKSSMQKKPKVSETGDPELDAKYDNKMYIQTYTLLYEMIDKMTQLFEDIRHKEGEKLLAQLL